MSVSFLFLYHFQSLSSVISVISLSSFQLSPDFLSVCLFSLNLIQFALIYVYMFAHDDFLVMFLFD